MESISAGVVIQTPLNLLLSMFSHYTRPGTSMPLLPLAKERTLPLLDRQWAVAITISAQ